jgi:hypothetical protein
MAEGSDREEDAARSELNASIGEVGVHLGEPPDGNPYRRNSLIGDERVEALRRFKYGEDTSAYTFWYMPCHGGARRITRDEVNWETSRV